MIVPSVALINLGAALQACATSLVRLPRAHPRNQAVGRPVPS